jgi:phospholipid/cholesterol/gamma-HCH transport system permease protein
LCRHISNAIVLLFSFVGAGTLPLLGNFGAIVVFFSLAFVNIFRRKQLREIVNQVFYIGVGSPLIVMLSGLFAGMILGLQLFCALNTEVSHKNA